MKSRFIKGRAINGAQQAFESWMADDGYESSIEMYPGSVLASDLVQDFFSSVSISGTQAKTVRRHAKNIGFVSAYRDEEDDW